MGNDRIWYFDGELKMSRDREYTKEEVRSDAVEICQMILGEELKKTKFLLDEAIDIIKDHHDKLWSVELDDRVAMFLSKLEQDK